MTKNIQNAMQQTLESTLDRRFFKSLIPWLIFIIVETWVFNRVYIPTWLTISSVSTEGVNLSHSCTQTYRNRGLPCQSLGVRPTGRYQNNPCTSLMIVAKWSGREHHYAWLDCGNKIFLIPNAAWLLHLNWYYTVYCANK